MTTGNLPASTPAHVELLTLDLSIERVKRMWQSSTWESVDEQFRPIRIEPRHVLSVAHEHVPAHQHPEFFQFTNELIFRRELIAAGLCTDPSCKVVRQLGRPAHSFALIEDLFTTARIGGSIA